MEMKTKILLSSGLLILLVTSVLALRSNAQPSFDQDKKQDKEESFEIKLTDDEWKKRLPHLESHPLNNAGHYLLEDDFENCRKKVTSFLLS